MKQVKINVLYRRTVGVTLAVLLCALQCQTALALEKPYRLEAREHGQIRFADMAAEPPDEASFRRLAAEIKALSRSAENGEKAATSFERLRAQFDQIRGAYYLASVQADLNVNDEKAQKREIELENLDMEMEDLITTVAQDVLASPCGDYARKVWGHRFCQAVGEEAPMTEEQKELLRREAELVSEYGVKSAVPYTTQWEGREVCMEDVDQLYDDGEITGGQWDKLCGEICRAENEALGPLYLELLQVRSAYAETVGEENYLDYAYAGYMRGYGTEEAAELFENVREILVPLEDKLLEVKDTDGIEEYHTKYLDTEETMKRVEPFLGEIGPELQDAYQYMKKYGLFDLDFDADKMDGGYTISLPADRSVFMFNQPYGSFFDFTTFIHEFGHYNQAYWTDPYPVWPEYFNIDIMEVHSQGLELLYLEYYDEMLGEYAGEGRTALLETIVGNITGACMVDQLEQYAYAHPDTTLEELNDEAERIGKEYGYVGVWQPYDWVETSHIYESPGYYIAYATSAIAAFQLWAESLTDREAAVDDYFTFVKMADYSVEDALEACGLQPLFEESVLRNIRSCVEKELGVFRDSYGHWSETYLDTVAYQEIAAGRRDAGGYTVFEPEEAVTRVEFASMLYQLADHAGEKIKPVELSDVDGDDWYAGCVNWAIGEGIAELAAEGVFAPEAPLSRQDMALMAWRFTEAYEVETAAGGRRMRYFTDESAIGGEAGDAVRQLWEKGVLSGYPDGSFRPAKPAARSEAAVIAAKFCM